MPVDELDLTEAIVGFYGFKSLEGNHGSPCDPYGLVQVYRRIGWYLLRNPLSKQKHEQKNYYEALVELFESTGWCVNGDLNSPDENARWSVKKLLLGILVFLTYPYAILDRDKDASERTNPSRVKAIVCLCKILKGGDCSCLKSSKDGSDTQGSGSTAESSGPQPSGSAARSKSSDAHENQKDNGNNTLSPECQSDIRSIVQEGIYPDPFYVDSGTGFFMNGPA